MTWLRSSVTQLAFGLVTPVTAGRDGTIRKWDTSNGRSELFLGHEYIIWSLDVSPSGELVSAGADKTIRRWNIDTRQQIGPSLLFHTDEVWTARYSRDGAKILSGGADGQLVLWDAAKSERITSIVAHPNGVSGAHELPDGTIITSGCDASTPATGCTRSMLKLWSLAP
jgi:WD40 repeat protein